MKPPRDTPSYLIALATIALLVFVAWQVGGVMSSTQTLIEDAEERTQRAEERTLREEQRTDQLVGILVEGREEWGPALEQSLHIITQLCEAEPECEP